MRLGDLGKAFERMEREKVRRFHKDMIILTRTTFNLGVPIFRVKFRPGVLLELNVQDVQSQVQLMRP